MIRKTFVVITLILCTYNLFAGGFALTGVGSRATSMGGAMRGLSDDGSAMYWNPAGLGFMNDSSIDLGGTFILPGSKWDNKGTLTTGGTVIAGYEHKEYESKKILRMFPSIAYTNAKHSTIKFGIGVFVPYGLGATWDAYKSPTTMPYANTTLPLTYVDGFPEEELMSSLAIIDIHPTVAYQISPKLSAGLGLSVYYSTIQLKKDDFKPNAANPTDQSYQYAPITTNLEGSGMGYGANFGVLYKMNDQLSLGLSGKTPGKISLEGDAEVLLWTPGYATVTANKLGGKSDITADLNLPGDIGIGLSYKVQPNWAVNFDYSYTMWNTLEKVKIEMDEPIVLTPTTSISQSTINFKWEDTHRISVGTEYTVNNNAYRCGFFWDQSPIPDETFSPTFPDINDKISSNIGYGKQIGSWTFDVNVQYIIFMEREIDVQNYTNNNKNGIYNANSLSGNIGISYKL